MNSLDFDFPEFLMESICEAPCIEPQPPEQQLLRKEDKTNKAALATRCLCSHVISFWADVSRFWRPLQRLQPAKLELQAHLITQTSKSWIYVTHMPPCRVTKLSKNTELLYREYRLHKDIEEAFKVFQIELAKNGFDLDLPYIPQCSSFYANISSSPCSETFRYLDGFPENASGYFMEYIRPLNEHHTKYLIRRYLTHSAQHQALSDCASKHFLAKVYLGDTKPLSDQWNTNLHDRPAYLDHLLHERVAICYLAANMGATLAILHWSCGIDARGVEFVLGRDNRGRVQFWLIDFADCQDFEKTPEAVTTQLVDAVIQNEPFWPRLINIHGLRELWACFRVAYLEVSDFIMTDDDDDMRRLPLLFMGELDKIWGVGRLLT